MTVISMKGGGVVANRFLVRLWQLLGGLLVFLAAFATTAQAISAPIHISGTAGEGVYIRTGPGTSYGIVGWMPEGTSPDYNCFSWGQNINGVPIWFSVNYGGVTGYYASFYDDSSYHSNEELTAKYGVPLCGSPPPTSAPTPAPATSPAPAPAASGDHVYPVTNAAGGIFWRSGPDWNTPNSTPGNGFYEGSLVRVTCYQSGTSVPGSNNTMWEQATIAGGPGSGSGWINEHFVNDGAAINQPSPGLPPCVGQPPATVSPPRAPAKPAEQVLVVDPSYWCLTHDIHRFDTQVREAGWKVQFNGLEGTPHQNDWKCRYLVVMTFPGPTGRNGPLPPTTQRFPIDFRAVCEEQYPGSRLQYELGPVYSTSWPWVCIGAPGKYYPPPKLNISMLLGADGFAASGVPASAAGSLQLQLAAGPAGRARAAGGHPRLLAVGSRQARHAGRYRLAVRLTSSGRRFLKRVHAFNGVFSLRFISRRGHTRFRSTKVHLVRRAPQRSRG
jgi:uncharacterized protein YraI